MSTDSTELTFVRCPSCRSLVPAVSTRCRMCGAALDAGAAGAQEDTTEQSSGGRVRQRTMSSKADSELAEATEQLREEHGGVVEAVAESEEDVPFDDPLSAYIEEVDVIEEASSAAAESDEPFASPLEAVEEVVAEEQSPFAEPEPEAEIPVTPEPVTVVEEEPTLEPAAIAEPVQPAAPVEATTQVEDEQPTEPVEPKVRVEHGGRSKKSGGLSFSKPAEAAAPQPAAEPVEVVEEPVESEQVVEASPFEEEEVEVAQEYVATESEPEPEPEPEPVREAKKETVPEFEEDDEEDEEEFAPPPPPKKKAKNARASGAASQVASAPAVDGRLFGWLISYTGSADGYATELREGRFFVTSSSLKKTDLILNDESVSTPHAMVTITVDTGFVVQDLMSDRGVFIRRRAAGAYERHPEPTTLENGDWVRFGDVEFLVSLVPYVGEE